MTDASPRAVLQIDQAGQVAPHAREVADELTRRGWRVFGVWPDDADFTSLPLDEADLVYAEAPVVEFALTKLGVFDRVIPDYPAALVPFLGRQVTRLSVRDLVSRDWETSGSLFLKPVATKMFEGRVVGGAGFSAIAEKLSPDEQLYISPVMEWRAEARAYMRGDEIIGVCAYRRDDDVALDDAVVRAAIDALIAEGAPPAGYCIDFGVDQRGATQVVEFNDGYSLINYGLPSEDFVDLLIGRWRELTQKG